MGKKNYDQIHETLDGLHSFIDQKFNENKAKIKRFTYLLNFFLVNFLTTTVDNLDLGANFYKILCPQTIENLIMIAKQIKMWGFFSFFLKQIIICCLFVYYWRVILFNLWSLLFHQGIIHRFLYFWKKKKKKTDWSFRALYHKLIGCI